MVIKYGQLSDLGMADCKIDVHPVIESIKKAAAKMLSGHGLKFPERK